MRLLAIDTSTPRLLAGVANLDDASGDAQLPPVVALSEITDDSTNRHAEVLMPSVQRALADAAVDARELDGVVVGLGPGPFTGLRVGIVTAAAVADACGIPVWGVGSHLAIADGTAHSLVVTDARRREVYYSTYDADGVQQTIDVAPMTEVVLRGPTDGLEVVIHPGVGVYAGQLAAFGVRVEEAYPTTESLVRAAVRERLVGGGSTALQPIYLRAPDAAEPRARAALNVVLPEGH